MTEKQLAEMTRQTMNRAFAELSTLGCKRPYGMSIGAANAAMMEGVALSTADVIMAASKPTPLDRGACTDHVNRIIISRVACADVAGSA